jgi:hypothetical protein
VNAIVQNAFIYSLNNLPGKVKESISEIGTQMRQIPQLPMTAALNCSSPCVLNYDRALYYPHSQRQSFHRVKASVYTQKFSTQIPSVIKHGTLRMTAVHGHVAHKENVRIHTRFLLETSWKATTLKTITKIDENKCLLD